jgi:hypothetical protein
MFLLAAPVYLRQEEARSDQDYGEGKSSSSNGLVRRLVHNLSNAIHKHHDLLLQAFSDVGELSNVTEAENARHFPAIYKWVHLARFGLLQGPRVSIFVP